MFFCAYLRTGLYQISFCFSTPQNVKIALPPKKQGCIPNLFFRQEVGGEGFPEQGIFLVLFVFKDPLDRSVAPHVLDSGRLDAHPRQFIRNGVVSGLYCGLRFALRSEGGI